MILDTRINTYTTNGQHSSSMAALSDGGVVIIWQSLGQDGASHGIYGQRYDASGAAHGPEFRVNTYTASNQQEPAVTSLPNGGFVVTWQSNGQNGAGSSGIYGQRYGSDGNSQGAEFQISDIAGFAPSESSVTALPNNGFVVTWQSYNAVTDDFDIYGQIYDAAGVKQGVEFNITNSATKAQELPTITALSDGFVVTWQAYDQENAEYDIYGQRYDGNGVALGTEFLINTNTSSDQSRPSITALANGGFVVVWQSYQQDGGENGIYGQRYDANGNALDNEFLINTDTSSDQSLPSLTALSGGGFVVIWQSNQEDGSDYKIYGQRYGINGEAQGTEFVVSSNLINPNHASSAIGLADGGYAVSWTSSDDDGTGVYAKRYDALGHEIDWTININHAPTGSASAMLPAGTEDTDYIVSAADLLQGFSDIDVGNTLSITGLSADHGTVTDNLNGTFTISHAANYNGPVSLNYAVIDGLGGSDAGNQNYTAVAVNDAPTLLSPLVNRAVKINTTNWNYDAGASFRDPDLSDSLNYSATLANGSPLPSWLQINSSSGVVAGSPGFEDRGTYALTITATDTGGATINAPLIIAATLFEAGQLLVSTAGNDSLTGISANDTATYGLASGPTTVSLAINGQQNTGGSGLDTLTNIDNLIGGGFSDTFRGNASNNVLDGAAGADTLIGGVGNDTYFVDNVSDLVTENANAGLDAIISSATYTLPTNLENLTLIGASAINGTGNNLANLITGNALDNILSGLTGNDRLIGGDGNDTLDGVLGNDTLTGGTGNDIYIINSTADIINELANEGTDTVQTSITRSIANTQLENITLTGANAINATGNAFNNVLIGNSNNNTLIGNAGNDTLGGEDGNDILTGAAGSDTLAGGAGNDTFAYAATAHSIGVNQDIIIGFVSGVDRIDLSAIDANTNTGRNNAFQFIGNTSFTAPGQVRYDATIGLLEANVNNSSVAELQIQLAGAPTLIATDILL